MKKKNNYFDDLLDEIQPSKSNIISEENTHIDSNKASKDECIIESENICNVESKVASKESFKNDSNKYRSNVLDSLPKGKKDHKEFYKGIYFDEDIFKVLTSIIQQNGKGRRNIQSKIVNDCLREVFEERNFL